MATKRAVPFFTSVSEGTPNGADIVAQELTKFIVHWHAQGWSFSHLENVSVAVQPGCFSAFLGAKSHVTTFQVAILEGMGRQG
jgi:hypothetical protein